MLRIIVWYIAFLIIITDSSVYSQAVMQLMPPVQEVRVGRGRTETFTVTVRNAGDSGANSNFSIHDMDITIDGRPFIADSGYTRGCGEWIKLESMEYVVEAHGSLLLKGTITVPRKSEGGYYALIRGSFETINIPLAGKKVNIDGSAVTLQTQAMVVLLLTVPSSRNKPIIVPDTLFVFPRGEEKESGSTINTGFNNKKEKGWKVVMPVRNDGNIHTRVSGRLSFWSESGAHIESAPLLAGKGYLLPGKVRNFEATGKNVLSDGYYMMRIILQTAKRSSMSKDFTFAIYKGEVYPGAMTEKLAELVRVSSPGFLLRNPFLQRKFTPGGSSYMSVQLKNTINDTLTLLPRKMEWDLNEVGLPTLGNKNTMQPRSCTDWIELFEDKIIILPGKSKSFKFKLNSPEDVNGAYYAAIVFDRDRFRPDLPAEFMSSRTQLIALTTPRDLHYKVKIDTIMVKKESSPELTLYRFLSQVSNTGNVHCYARGSLSLEKEVAKGIYKPVGQAYEFGDRQNYLLPGNKRTFEIDIPNLESGQYRVILAVNYEEEGQPVVKFQRFNIR